MTKITENVIENFCIELLEKQDYETIYAPDIAPSSGELLLEVYTVRDDHAAHMLGNFA